MKTTHATHRMVAAIVFVLLAGAELTLGGSRAAAAPGGSRWGANYFPNVPLVNQDGETLRFYDDVIKGKVVAINFIYTSCPDACPLETAKLRQVYEALGDRVGHDVFMYSISIDPEHDTPAVLKEYVRKFKIGPGWQFLTGDKKDIDQLRTKLGMYRQSSGEENLSDHNVSLIVGNESTGKWIKRSPLDNPLVLASLLGEQLHGYKKPHAGRQSYATAGKLAKFDRGEDLFRTRCSACHTLGKGDGVGPDLLGVVARRERAWLTRWLMAPDKMLAEKDSIAMALYAKYRNMPMPNLKLNEVDAKALIEFMDAQTNRLGAGGPGAARDTGGTDAVPAKGDG